MKLIGGKAPPAAPQSSEDLKEKLNKIEERVYSHDAKFAEQQVVIDATSFNLKMLQSNDVSTESKFTILIRIKLIY